MKVRRRKVLSAAMAGSVLTLAGCLEDDDDGISSSSTSSSSGGNNCEMQTRTRQQELVDEWESVSAGGSLTWRVEMEPGQTLIMEARQTGGNARPRLIVEDPRGRTIEDFGPREFIRRTVTARESGRYYVEFYNEALINSGQWDMDIILEYEEEVEVC